MIDPSVKLENIKRIRYNASLEDPTYIIHAQHTDIGVGRLRMPRFVHIRKGVEIDLTGNVSIGEHTELSKSVKIFTHKNHWKHSKGLRKEIQTVEAIDLTIGEDVFIGENEMILCVSSVGQGAVIGAGAVLTKDVPGYEIWAGNPAVKIGERQDV